MLAHRLRRRPNIGTTLGRCVVFAAKVQEIYRIFVYHLSIYLVDINDEMYYIILVNNKTQTYIAFISVGCVIFY